MQYIVNFTSNFIINIVQKSFFMCNVYKRKKDCDNAAYMIK